MLCAALAILHLGVERCELAKIDEVFGRRIGERQWLQIDQDLLDVVQRRALEAIVEKVRAGGSLSTALREAGTFPPLLVYLAASGESAGQLGPMLERAADYLEREFESFTSAALALLEPAIIIVMGVAVATIILAILLPILQLQNLTGL